jgi:N-acetyl-anhydromuramyl-L-alanine amidase AmpD
MSEESKIISSFSLQETLNPKIWNNYANPEKASLKPEIRKKLLEIAHEFMDFIDVEFFVDDIIFTGSLSNFNWSDFSDVDLHLEVDFTQFDKDSVELYRELFNLKKLLFNTNHDITIKGFEVELYVQDIIEPHTSGGIYSVLYDEWTAVPEKKDVKIDKNLLKTKIKTWTKKIDEVTEQVQNGDYDESILLIKELRDKIKKYRKAGLEEKGEFSYENLVFKFLRRGKYIERLIDLGNKLKDKKLSLESLNESLINEIQIMDITSLSEYPTNRKFKKKDFFMVHHTAGSGTAEDVMRVLNKRGLSVQWIVDKEGVVYRALPQDTIGAHTGSNAKMRSVKNSNTEGVEVIGLDDQDIKRRHDSDIKSGILPKQAEAVRQLVKYLGYSPDQVVGHGDVSTNKQATEGKTIKEYIIQNWDKPISGKFDISNLSTNNIEPKKEKNLFDRILFFLGFGKEATSSEKDFTKELEELIGSNKELKWEKTGRLEYDNDVEILQSVLQLLGYSLPEWGIDGKFGPETNAAVINFQKKNSLTPNGVVDKNTLKTILKELSKIDLDRKKIDGIQKEKKKVKIVATDNKNKILKFLMDKGLTIEQASGIAGNLQAESNFNPEAIGDSGTSLGIAQWHKSRKENLINFCGSKKQDSKSLECQLNFLWDELTTKYSNVLSLIKSSENANESAEIFASKYEKPRSTDYSRRIKFAEKIYNDALIS